jgi:hypothetical protein
MAERLEFTERTKKIVAGRSSYRCSIPACDRLTIGPGFKEDEVATTGVADHIFSASKGGPRGSSGLTDEQVMSPANAIWLCADHARLIDANRGDRFPAALLLSYKALHEARVSREQRAIHAPWGWFQEVIIDESPVFAPDATVRLAKSRS